MRSYFAKNKAKSIVASQKGAIKLNIGCGTDYKKGWINIDNNSDNNIVKLDLYWDLLKPLPFEDNSVDFIFSEHFFEHFTVDESQKIMKDMLRILRPGGVMRIAMPDLEMVVDHYLNVPVEKDPIVKRFKFDFVKTKAEWMNMSFRWWGHKWLYDWEELERRLKQAGYTKIIRCKMGKSKHKELCGLETRDESLLIAEVTK